MARRLGPRMGVDFVVENVTGGGGARAMSRVANAPPDGSILYAATPSFIFTSLLSRPANTYADLDPIVNVFLDQEVVYTRAESPFETLGDVIRKARSGAGRWGAASPGSLERQALERLARAADVDAAIISHDGGGDLILNVLNGTLDVGVGEAQEIRGQLDAGRLRLLAVFSAARLPGLPEVPTVAESGYDVVVTKFRGLMGPPGTPPDIVKPGRTRFETCWRIPNTARSTPARCCRPPTCREPSFPRSSRRSRPTPRRFCASPASSTSTIAIMPKDLAGAVLLLLVAAGYYALAGGINPSALDDGVGAAGIPFIYAALVAALGLALAARAAAARWFGRAAPRLADAESRRLLGAAVMLGIGVAYVAVVAFLGYPLALAGVLAGAALYQGERPGWRVVRIASAGGAAFWLFFDGVLRLDMPSGFWPSLWGG